MNRGVVAVVMLLTGLQTIPSRAFDVYRDATTDLRLDNTLSYTASFRLFPRDPALLADPNSDDGDRNFTQGLVGDRLDLLSQLDYSRGDFGAPVMA